MVADVVKKRGRPRKVVTELIAAEKIEPIETGQIFIKASSIPQSAISTKTVAMKNSSKVSTVVKKTTSKILAPSVASGTSLPVTQHIVGVISESISPPPSSPTTFSTPKVTPVNSRIVDQVRALSSKARSAPKISRQTPNVPNPTSPASPTSNTHTNPTPQTAPKMPYARPPRTSASTPASSPPRTSEPPSSSPSSSPPIPQFQTPYPQKSIPIAGLNSSIVSQISSRAGARPGTSKRDLPPNYKSVARKVTWTIVAMPIAIVTSWVLYQRLVLGEERKLLVRPPTAEGE